MLKQELSRNDYVDLLAQLLLLHEVIEELISRHPALQEVADLPIFDAQILRLDLLRLGVFPASAIRASALTTALMEDLNQWAKTKPWCLVGAIFIFEGSRMGAMLVTGPIAKSLGVPCEPGNGIDFLLKNLQARAKGWHVTKTKLDNICCDPGHQADAREGALHTMRVMCELYNKVRSPAHSSSIDRPLVL